MTVEELAGRVMAIDVLSPATKSGLICYVCFPDWRKEISVSTERKYRRMAQEFHIEILGVS